MPKINILLDAKAHKILTDYKKMHKHSNLDEALNAYIKEAVQNRSPYH